MKGSLEFEAARLSVRLDALAANHAAFQRLAGAASVAAVVKADGYGLGADAVARTLNACDNFFVARLDEGVRLRATRPDARIFVLDGAAPDAVPALLNFRLTPVLNSLADVAAWQAAAVSTRQSLDAVLHVDTGMNRLGLDSDELAVLASDAARRLTGLHPVLVMSHLACADDAADPMNARQLSRFRQALAMLPPAPASLAASAGVLLGAEYHFDMVRPGIGLYGANPKKTGPNPFKPVAVLEGRVLQLRRIDKDQSVGYAAAFHAKRPTMLATVALGYADGVMRAAAATGFAVVNGARVPFAGRISMDLCSLDVTDASVKVGDWAELLGDSATLDEAAQAMQTNAYEVLTGLSPRLARQYIEGAA